ncbi:MAG: N-acetylglucosamine-6-phosphate deacetylase, partial [Janthinobacterium lividum]
VACTPAMVGQLTRRLAALGTTTFLPTIITGPLARTLASLAVVAEARRVDAMVHHAVPFVHLEGPHISPNDGYRGAHPVDDVRPPSMEEFDRLQSRSGGLIGMVTLSPHWATSTEFIRGLTARGILVSLGHTHGSREQIEAAVDAGARLSTHLGNGIAATLARHTNPIWAQLADDRLMACLIADGVHLPAEVLRVMLRAKGLERTVLVSDSVALAGSPAGEYTTPIGGTVVVGSDGSIRMRDLGLLAGSGIALRDAVARAVSLAGIPLADSIRMATSNPGRFAGGCGCLQTGAVADLFTFRWTPGDRTLHIQDVYVRGTRIAEQPEARGV